MIGERYWTTGIVLTPVAENVWCVSLDFLDSGFCDDGSSEGTLRLRYQILTEDLCKQSAVLWADAQRLGIEQVEFGATVYVPGDGEWESINYPENWREIAGLVADSLGFRAVYREIDEAQS